MTDRWLRKPEVAELLGVSVRTVERMIASQEIPAARIRRCRRIPEAAVRALMAARERPAGQEPPAAAQPIAPPADPFTRVTCPGCGRSGAVRTSTVKAQDSFQCSRCGRFHRL